MQRAKTRRAAGQLPGSKLISPRPTPFAYEPGRRQFSHRIGRPRLGAVARGPGRARRHSGAELAGGGPGAPSAGGRWPAPSARRVLSTPAGAHCAGLVEAGRRGPRAGAAPWSRGSGTTSQYRWPRLRRSAAPKTASATSRPAQAARDSGSAGTARAACLILPRHSAELGC
jgi:hypothetical protein